MFKKLLAFFLFAALAVPAQAQLSLSPPEEAKVRAQLVAEDDGIKPGAKFWLALRQEITPEWHTYWKNPGDTGLATSIKWELPAGFSAAEISFPTPARQRTGELVNYGYQNSVMLPIELTAPADLKIGDKATIKAKASWLVCRDICIPETASFTLDLKVIDKPAPGAWASAFTAVRAKSPQPHQSRQAAALTDETVELTLDPLPLDAAEMPEEAYFFPADGLLLQHAATQKLVLEGRTLKLSVPRNKTRTTPVERVTGDVWLRTANGEKSFTFDAPVAGGAPVKKTEAPGSDPGALTESAATLDPGSSPGIRGSGEFNTAVTPVQTEVQGDATPGFAGALVAAFLGGILLNLMPCVFPVLSLKALSLVREAHHEDRGKVILGGMAYLLGVLASFTGLGVLLIGLKNAGTQIGWGFQLQSPVFVAALAVLLFFIGYALSGAITIGARLMGVGDGLTRKSGLAGSFFTGVLAVVVATPCTAPFMGGAIFYALTQSNLVMLSVLWALGLGLALPYVLLALFPKALTRFLPRPGLWMEHFKQFLAFPMLAASIWLVWVLAQQTGAMGVAYVLFAMLALAFAGWLYHTTQNRPHSAWQSLKLLLVLGALIVAGCLVAAQPEVQKQKIAVAGEGVEPFTPQRLAELRAAGKPVFVDMTAAWCITCLANDKAALSSEMVKTYFAEHGIVFLKGDWTNFDADITAYLKQFNRSGVPIYVYYPMGGDAAPPSVLPQILTPQGVIDAITTANQGHLT